MSVSGPQGAYKQHLEAVLEWFPENPVIEHLEVAWNHMIENYSKFQIATWGSLLVHEVIIYIYIARVK